MLDLRERREYLKLSQDQVAKMVGVSEATISRWETGGIKNLKRDKIYKLANALQLNPLDLVFDSIPSETVGIQPIMYPDEAAEFCSIYNSASEAERVQMMAIIRTFKKSK